MQKVHIHLIIEFYFTDRTESNWPALTPEQWIEEPPAPLLSKTFFFKPRLEVTGVRRGFYCRATTQLIGKPVKSSLVSNTFGEWWIVLAKNAKLSPVPASGKWGFIAFVSALHHCNLNMLNKIDKPLEDMTLGTYDFTYWLTCSGFCCSVCLLVKLKGGMSKKFSQQRVKE